MSNASASPSKGKAAAAPSTPGVPRLIDSSDPRRPNDTKAFIGMKPRKTVMEFQTAVAMVLLLSTFLTRNRVYAIPAFMMGVAAIFQAESLMPDTGVGPMQSLAFSGMALSNAYMPLLIDYRSAADRAASLTTVPT